MKRIVLKKITGWAAVALCAMLIPAFAHAAGSIVDSFARGGGESTPYNLQNHTASDASAWTKISGDSDNYQLAGASATLRQAAGSGIVRYYSGSSAGANAEAGILITRATPGGSYNYMTPIIRMDTSASSGVWAEADLSAGSIGLRRISDFTYVNGASTPGFTFPDGDYYIVVAANGSTFSMYVKQISSGMWLNGTSKAFDSATRIAVVSGTDTQSGTYIGMGGYTSGSSVTAKQFDKGAIGDLLAPVTAPASVPSAPLSPVAAPGNTSITLSWTVPTSDGGSAITSYTIYNASSNALVTTSATTSKTITGLTNGTPYSYYIKAVNTTGESVASATVTATPQILSVSSAPQNVLASPGDTGITLSWNAPATNGGATVTSYNIYNAANNALVTTSATTSKTITGLTNGTPYSYYVKAVNSVGESAASATVSASPIGLKTVAVTDSAFSAGLSPYVWYSGSGFVTAAGGANAYFKVGFTGTSFGITVDVSSQVAASMYAIAYPVLKYRIDGGAYQLLQLTSGSPNVTLASGLAPGSHTLEAHYQRNMYYDSWNTPVEQLKITGVLINSDSSLVPFNLYAKKMLIYGDSITEGQWIEATSSGNTGTDKQGALIANSTRVYATQLAEMLGAEFGNAAVGGQGWTTGGATNVPQFISSWDKYFASNSRLIGGKITPNPDMVYINMGTNNGVSDPAIVTTWLGQLRAAVNASTYIYLGVPFNGSAAPELTSAYNSYMSAHPSDRTYIINLGTINGYATTDGLHPDGPTNDLVASLLFTAINSITVPSAPTGASASLISGQANISWTASASNGNSTLLGYHVYDASSNALIATTAAVSTSIAVTQNGSTYSYYVKAYNAVGDSSASATVFVTTPDLAPPVISNVVSAPATNSAVITWTTDEPSDSAVEYGPAISYGSSTPIDVTMTTAHSVTISGLSGTTAYHYRVLSSDAAANAANSPDASFTTATTAVVPAVQSRGHAVIVTINSAPIAPFVPAGNTTPLITRNLQLSMSGDDVKALQQYLNAQGFAISASGAGSKGHETAFFGKATRAALIRFQVAHKIKPAVGYFGPVTRAFVQSQAVSIK